MVSRRFFAYLACLAVPATFAAGALAATELTFSTEPPAVYRKSIAPLLTPAEQVLAAAEDLEKRQKAGDSGSILLDETIYFVAADGAVFRAEHQLYRVNSEAAIEHVARNTYDFRSRLQKIHLVMARTLPPGGSWQPVKPEAAFVQSPQENQDASLYSDAAELVVVFPQIRVGSITEQVVLIEEPVFRIPGELTAMLYFAAGWPTDSLRQVVDLPSPMAARLIDTPVGAVPAPRRQDLPSGRSRFEWIAQNLPGDRGEPAMAPATATGPMVFLSTVESWDRLADWFRGLLAGRGELPAELRAKAREWTAAARTPDEVIRILHRHVADDIRYTGLEFGVAGFQPKRPAEVWSDGYGDCKDKANLLRVLLADQGISSTLALINTQHAGAVETRSPDFRHFDHAILAIDTPKGYLWADPTIPFLDPGQLGPGDAERQAFLVPADRGWRFATTPTSGTARIEVEAEVAVGADGRLEGWLAFDIDRWIAASYQEAFQGDQVHRLRMAQNVVRRFFPGAETVDLVIEATPRGKFRAKVFFTDSGEAEEGGADGSLAARDGGFLGGSFDQPDPRRSAFFQRRQNIGIRIAYRLPEGLAPAELPASFEVAVPALSSQAAWSCDKGLCRVEMRQEVRAPLVAPAEFPPFLQAKKALDAWLRRPLRLVAGGAAPGAAAQPAQLLADFPLMPTGEGQLRLLESKYPEGTNDAARRAALEKIAQWFPSDQRTLYKSSILLGTLACESSLEAERQGGAARLRSGLARYAGSISVHEAAWGRYLLAICDGVPDEESIPLLRTMAEDESLTAGRRAWSLLIWLEKIEKNSPAEAARLADRALAMTAAVAEDPHLAGLLWSHKLLLAADAGATDLDAQVEQALAGEARRQIADQLATTLGELTGSGETEATGRLAKTLERVAGRHAELEPVVAQLRRQLGAQEHAKRHAAIAADLALLFASSPPSWWEAQPLDRGTDQAAMEKKVQELADAPPIPPFVRQAVHLLVTFPSTQRFSERLYLVAWCFTEHFPQAPQVAPLLALTSRLAKTDSYYWEGRQLVGYRLSEEKDFAGAASHYRALAAEPDVPAAYRAIFLAQLGNAQMAAGKFAEASRAYGELAEAADLSVARVVDGLLRAALLELEQGRREEAWRYLRLLRQVDAKVVAKTSSPDQVSGFAALAADEKAGSAALASAESWWPSWLELEKTLGLAPATGPVVAVVGDLEERGRQMAEQAEKGVLAPVFALMRELAHAARWDPKMGIELAGVLSFLNNKRPEYAAPMRELSIAVYRSLLPNPDPTVAAQIDLMLAAQLFDAGETAEAHRHGLAVIDSGVGGALHQRALAILAMTASSTGTDRERVANELAKALDDTYPRDVRGMAVSVLAKLYRQLGRLEEERVLLERETAHPAIKGSARAAELEGLLARSRTGGGDELSQAFAAWRARFQLPFLDYAEPVSLDDSRLQGKKIAAVLEDGEWLEQEKVKIAFLVAADDGRPVTERTDALVRSLFSLGSTLPRQSRYREMLQAILDEPRFPPNLRSAAAMCMGLSLSENLPALDAFIARPGLPLIERQREVVMYFRSLAEARSQGAVKLGELVEQMLAGPLDDWQTKTFPELWETLVLYGDAGAAERLAPRLANLKTVAGDRQKENELQFTCRRALAEMAELRRAYDVVRSLLLPSDRPQNRPPEAAEIGDSDALGSLPPTTCRRLLLYELETQVLGVTESLQWVHHFVGCLDERDGKLARELGLALIGVLERDERRAEAILATLGTMSVDLPAATSFLEELRQKIGPDQKKTWQMVRLMQIASLLRSGGKVRFAAEAEALDPSSLRLLRFLEIRILLRDRDQAGAKAFLAALSPAELQSPLALKERLQLLRLVPEGPERQLVESAARRQIYESILSSLATGSWQDGQRAIRLSAEVDGRASYPRAWFDRLLATTENEIGRTLLGLADAETREDWPAAYEHAKTVIEKTALSYSDQWSLGRAAFHLGKKTEAKEALTLLVERAQDHPQLAEAREMLAKLAGKS
jgi:hypothetical protein